MKVFGGERLNGLGDKQARTSWRFLVFLTFVFVGLIFGSGVVSAEVDNSTNLLRIDFSSIADLTGNYDISLQGSNYTIGGGICDYGKCYDVGYSGNSVNLGSPILTDYDNWTLAFDGYVLSGSSNFITFVSQYLDTQPGRFYIGKHLNVYTATVKIGATQYYGDSLATSGLEDGWYLWVLRKQGNNFTVWVNGTLEYSFEPAESINANYNTTIGLVGGTATLDNAYIDNVMIFNATYNYSEIDEWITTYDLRNDSYSAPVSYSSQLTLDYPKEYQIFQRNVSAQNGSVLINGTTNHTQDILLKVDDGDWSTILTDINGTFNYLLNLSQGTYNLSVKTNESEAQNISYVSIGDIYLLIGQSNMDGRANTKTSFNTSLPVYGSMFQQATRCEYYVTSNAVNGSWKANNDPTGNGNAGGCYDYGSQWVITMNSLIASEGVPIAWITGSYGGTSIGLWDGDGNTHYDRALELVNQATYGNNEIRGVLWHQGENDASWSNDTYYPYLERLYGNLTADLTFDKFMIAPVARCDDSYGGGLAGGVQRAQYDFVNSNNNVVFGGESYDIGQSVDNLHYKTDTEITAFANRWVNAISKEFYNASDIFVPIIESAFLFNSTTIILDANVNLNISYFNDTSAEKVYGLRIYNSSVNLTEDNYTTEVSEDYLYVYLDSEIDTTYSVAYALENTTYNLPALRDSSTELPVLRLFEEAVIEENIPPSINLSAPLNESSTASTTINFQFNVSDRLNDIDSCSVFLDSVEYANTSVINETVTNTIQVSSIGAGSYSWYVYCNDTLGNGANSSTRILTITSATEETTTSGSSGGAPTYKVSSQNLVEGYSKRVYRNSRLSFESGGEAHSLKVNSINYSGSSVNVTVSSEPQTKLLFVGDEWKVDLDNDSSYDLLVRLDGVSYGAAEIFVLEIDERYGFEEETTDFTDEHGLDEVETANFANLREWIFVGVLVVLLVVGFFVFRFLKRGFKGKSENRAGKSGKKVGKKNGGKRKS